MSRLKNILQSRWAVLAILGLFMLGYNTSIIQKELLLHSGESVILALRPIDPRSLMQGDYMILEFNVERDIKNVLYSQPVEYGKAVLKESGGEHKFVRIYDGSVKKDEIIIEFHADRHGYKVSSGSFFFEEGLEPLYNTARYAELKVDKNGKAIIYALLDSSKQTLSKGTWDN